MTESARGFFVAPFGADGTSQGVAEWEFSRLSPKWLGACGAFLREHGPSFEASWGGAFARITTKVTATADCALLLFRVNGFPAASVALAKGASAAEESVLKMFVESLRRTTATVLGAEALSAFSDVAGIAERPLMIVVPWPTHAINEDDHALVRELAIHAAGAFFLQGTN